MLAPVIKKNDKQAKLLIGIFSVVVLVAVSFLSKFTITVELPFDKHIFALLNALLNTAVAFLLVAALVAVKQKKYTCLLYTSPSPRDRTRSRMPSSA